MSQASAPRAAPPPRSRSGLEEAVNTIDLLGATPELGRSSVAVSTQKTLRAGSASTSPSGRSPVVRRWNGPTKTAGDWDDLRRDPELCIEGGNCRVFLYVQGQSRRGYSFCVPFESLKSDECGGMLSPRFAQMILNIPHRQSRSSVPSCDLYIPAPDDASRETSFQWHLTTRNFFAFLFGKPLVGASLGRALVDLQLRLRVFRPERIENQADLLEYAEGQGYCDFVNCPDHALAMLHYAERFRLRELWIDAFAHCVGMQDSLSLSPEFQVVSPSTKALITRSSLEMDFRLGCVQNALRDFLADDLSSTNFGLGDGARAHLDRFRSFLRDFYHGKFEHWPPFLATAFPRTVYSWMHSDFENLYHYLVDLDSTDSMLTQKPASGGICVLQNLSAFNHRLGFPPLPHPMPLLPEQFVVPSRSDSQRGLKNLRLSTKQTRADRSMTAQASLLAATNIHNWTVTTCPLVTEYMRFERQSVHTSREEKVTMTDARKVRWFMVYGVLQYLKCALRTPKEVREAERPLYPLCCSVPDSLPWQLDACCTPASIELAEEPDQSAAGGDADLTPLTWARTAIQPDCQTGDYLTHTNLSRIPTPGSVEIPAPLRIATPLSRNSSTVSRRHTLFSSFGSRRSSIARTSSSAYCEILVHGYGNGLNEPIVDRSSSKAADSDAAHQHALVYSPAETKEAVELQDAAPSDDCPRSPARARPTKLKLDCLAPPDPKRTPFLESFQMEQLVSPQLEDGEEFQLSSPVSPTTTPAWSATPSASSTSSASALADASLAEDAKWSIESSGLLGGLVQIPSREAGLKNRDSVSSTISARSSKSTRTPSAPPKRSDFRFGFSSSPQEASGLGDDAASPLAYRDPTIGVAISGPSPARRSIDVVESSVMMRAERPAARSMSDPLIPPVVPRRSTSRALKPALDLYDALRLHPVSPRVSGEGDAAPAACSPDDAAPAPVIKLPGESKRRDERRTMSLRAMLRLG